MPLGGLLGSSGWQLDTKETTMIEEQELSAPTPTPDKEERLDANY